jgi:hypothetical protein
LHCQNGPTKKIRGSHERNWRRETWKLERQDRTLLLAAPTRFAGCIERNANSVHDAANCCDVDSCDFDCRDIWFRHWQRMGDTMSEPETKRREPPPPHNYGLDLGDMLVVIGMGIWIGLIVYVVSK